METRHALELAPSLSVRPHSRNNTPTPFHPAAERSPCGLGYRALGVDCVSVYRVTTLQHTKAFDSTLGLAREDTFTSYLGSFR